MYIERVISTILLSNPHTRIGTIGALRMIEETLHAANWWVEKIISYNISVESPSWQSHFEKVMIGLLRAKYHNHWYCDDPTRGSGYRCISNEYALDPILDKAAKAVSHSLPKNLARVVLTSEDRWLTMFVNPGQVTVRNKRFHEEPIYDPRRHICNKALRQTQSRKHRKSSSHRSKSDDDTLETLDEREAKSGAMSDPEDNNTSNSNATTDKVDFKRIFLEKIHDRARVDKEKEIEAHVEAYRKELKLEQPDASQSASASQSQSASASNRSSLNLEDAASDSINRLSLSPSKDSVSVSSPTKTPSKSNSQSTSGTPSKPGQTETEHSQILKLLSANNIERHNLSGQLSGHEFLVDTDNSNYGKHLSRILNACKIHRRNMLDRDETERATTREESATPSRSVDSSHGLSDHPDLLFSSRSQPLSSHDMHSHFDHDHLDLDHNDRPLPLNGKHRPLNGKHTNGNSVKSVTQSLLHFDLDARQVTQVKHEAVPKQEREAEAEVEAAQESCSSHSALELASKRARLGITASVYHESEASEIASLENQDASCNSSPIYDSATPPTPTPINDEQNASPSSKGGSDSGLHLCAAEELAF